MPSCITKILSLSGAKFRQASCPLEEIGVLKAAVCLLGFNPLCVQGFTCSSPQYPLGIGAQETGINDDTLAIATVVIIT